MLPPELVDRYQAVAAHCQYRLTGHPKLSMTDQLVDISRWAERYDHQDVYGTGKLIESLQADMAEMLGKPESYVMVSLDVNPHMLFAGQDAPLAYLELKSIGLPGDRTRAFSDTLCGLITAHLGVAPDRTYIEFSDAARHLWGWNSGTF